MAIMGSPKELPKTDCETVHPGETLLGRMMREAQAMQDQIPELPVELEVQRCIKAYKLWQDIFWNKTKKDPPNIKKKEALIKAIRTTIEQLEINQDLVN